MESFSGLAFLGALAIFMYGIRLSRMGVQLLAGDRLRSLVTRLTDRRLTAVGIGILTTLILQSSTATTVMLVGFAATGAITLVQAMGVILGADIGTTFVVVLLTVRGIADYALLLLVAGVLLEILSRRKKTRYISMVLLGFGLVFFGMQLMIRATAPLAGSSLLAEIFALLGQNVGYGFFAALVFTALVQNSATTLGLLIGCSFSGLLTVTEAIPFVLGANVGTCVASILNSFTGGIAAKRVAAAHLFFKLSGALIALALIEPFSAMILQVCSWLPGLESAHPSQIALAHVGFNLTLSLFFLPFIGPGARLIQKLIPESYQPEPDRFRTKYLDDQSMETPAIALANAKSEILRMAEITFEMFRQLIMVFEKDDPDLLGHLEEEDDKVDYLNREIKFYLARLSQEALNPDQGKMQLNFIAMISDLEEIGDIINKNILELATKKITKGRHFSESGWKEIREMHAKVLENFQLAIATLASEDESIARKLMRHEKHLDEMEDRYREAHLQRLHKGMKEAIETSSIHLDLLSNFRRINAKLLEIVTAALPGKDLRE